jgi:predicted ATP-grasp superfamily ATP-dependent carboligase
MKREFGEVVLCEFENCDCDGAPVIESFPSIGLVGVLTGKQIVKTLNLPLIGVIQLENLEVSRPRCVSDDKGRLCSFS